MARIAPFRGIHYNPSQVKLSDVVTPPYDVIAPGEDKKLLARSPYNFAHVILPRPDGYKEVRQRLDKWLSDRVLVADPMPRYYLYEQTFTLDGTKHARRALLCGVELRDFSEGIVRPHERTHAKPQADRLQILRDTKCHLSPVFAVVRDKEGFLAGLFEEIAYHSALLEGESDDGIRHAAWRFDPAKADVAPFFADKPVYIVDGHHRYNSALAYAKELGVLGNASHPAAYMYFAIVNAYDPALCLLPTHRLAKGAPLSGAAREKWLEAFEAYPASEEEVAALVTQPTSLPRFAVASGSDWTICVPKRWEGGFPGRGKAESALSVVWTDELLLKECLGIGESERSARVQYGKDWRALDSARGASDTLVAVPPLSVEAVLDVADEGGFMPQKSTYFHPKLGAGIVIKAAQ